MDLKDAISRYAGMVVIGAEALQRIADKKLEPGQRSSVESILNNMAEDAERLRSCDIAPSKTELIAPRA